jgi:hypothetical protein
MAKEFKADRKTGKPIELKKGKGLTRHQTGSMSGSYSHNLIADAGKDAAAAVGGKIAKGVGSLAWKAAERIAGRR